MAMNQLSPSTTVIVIGRLWMYSFVVPLSPISIG